MSWLRIIALGTLVLLTACGGSSDSPTIAAPVPTAVEKGIEGGGIVNRFATGFTKVTVSGMDFDLPATGLTVTVNGAPGTIQDIQIGYVVGLQATTNDDGVTATATLIYYSSDVEGPIAAGSIDTVNQSFVALGQTVIVTAETVFSDDFNPRSLDGLADGDFVEVSGFRNANGEIVATRISLDMPGEFEVVGTISNLQSANFLFNIADLVVDYSNAVLEDFDGADPADGDVVEVKGNTLGVNGELLATEVELEELVFTGVNGDLAEIEGFITRFVSATDFDVAGFPVTTNGQTSYEDGTVADLALNVRVEVEGTLDGNGVLVAGQVEFETGAEQADNRISGVVETIDTNADSLEVFGITIQVNASTRIEDKSDADVRPFNFDDLNVGDFAEVRGFEDPIGSQVVTAVLLEREDLDDDRTLQGFLESVSDPTLEILGVTVRTDAGTQFEDTNEMPITAAEFFGAVTVGTLVKAEGDFDGSEIIAREVELED